jgi:hypothetical protein
MSVDLRYFSLGALLLFHEGSVQAEVLPDSSYGFSTTRYTIQMRVSFLPPYEGKRLVVYRNGDPGKEICPSIEGGPPGCVENFVGAVAAVAFTVNRIADGRPAGASIREVVTLVDQSPGLPDRLPYVMSVKLVNGSGSDLQAFGYDESPLPAPKRPAEREVAKAAWRRYRQELYLDKDRRPFAVVEWLHTTTRIHILRVGALPSLPMTSR